LYRERAEFAVLAILLSWHDPALNTSLDGRVQFPDPTKPLLQDSKVDQIQSYHCLAEFAILFPTRDRL
jgi:hypothetical protein